MYTILTIVYWIGRSLGIYLQNEEKFTYKELLKLNESNAVITSVVPADFDNDVQMDLLITISTDSDDPKVEWRVYWGKGSHGLDKDPYRGKHAIDQPFILE